MQMDDMILVSIDDHYIEPPDMWKNHVPAKWQDDVPRVVRNEAGVDEWVFQGQATSTPFGMAATVGWPPEQWGFHPGSYTELRPGCFDVHERVRDMNANGVLASMNFPTMAGWNARTFAEGDDKELGPRDAPGLQRLGHRRVVCGLSRSVHPARASSRCGTSSWQWRRSTGSARRAAARSASSRPRTCRGTRASSPATGTR